MNKPLLPLPKRLALLLLLSPLGAAAQSLNFTPLNAQNEAGTYTDLGTTGTVIATANTDDANSAAQNIGFSFPYNGQTFSTFSLSTNGFIKLSSTPLSDPFWFFTYAQTETSQGQTIFPGSPFGSTDGTTTNLIAPFATDLTSATAGVAEYRVATTGTAPNRVCTIQWKNVRDKPKQATSTLTTVIGTQVDNFSFQVKLYETSGQIEFVYGPSTAGAGPDAFRTVAVGLKGNDPTEGNLLMADKNSTSPWSSSIFISNYYVNGDPHNVRSSVRPDVGRTYRFRASATQDAAVMAVYTLGQVPVGSTHAVQANVRNVGTQALTNLLVRLSVTGINSFATTQTVPTLAPGASTTVTFAGYPVGQRLGTNNITVSVPADAYPSTDSRTETQTVTVNTRNYAPVNFAAANVARFGFGTSAGITAAKYSTSASTTIQAVTNFFSPTSNSAGQTVYAVVANAAGTILGRTPDYVVQASDISTTKTFTFTTPVNLSSGDFFVGIAQPAGTVAHYPVGLLEELPTRVGSFYDANITGGNFADRADAGYGRFMIGAVLTNPVLGTTAAAAAPALQLWPNPTAQAASVQLHLGTGPASAATPVALRDALGRLVRQSVVPAGQQQTSLSTTGLPAGLYTVQCGAATAKLRVE